MGRQLHAAVAEVKELRMAVLKLQAADVQREAARRQEREEADLRERLCWNFLQARMDALEDKQGQALVAKEARPATPTPRRADGFRVSFRGGKWTRKHSGMAWDSTRGENKSDDVKRWCARYSLNTTRTYARKE